MSGIYAIPSLAFSLFFYSMITYSIYSMYKKIRDRSFQIFDLVNYHEFLQAFLYKASTLMILMIVIIGGFAVYENEVDPATMPIYTISNGDKTVIFHAMSHIGTPKFYEQVKKNIELSKKDGYVLYFEWVTPGSKENQDAFDKALWVKLDKDTYSHMSKLYGLINQDNNQFLNLVNDKDYNVDVSIDDIMVQYNQLKVEKWIQNRAYAPPVDISSELMKELSKLRENELKVLRYINKSFINVIVKSEWLQQAIQDQFANKELFDVILNKRNDVIVNKILTSEDKKIIATYWLLHFAGIFDKLQAADIRWRIIKIDYLYPIK